jgi:hypothetical protein
MFCFSAAERKLYSRSFVGESQFTSLRPLHTRSLPLAIPTCRSATPYPDVITFLLQEREHVD